MKKRPKKKRLLKPRHYGGGLYTEAGKRAFIMSALRKARWACKYQCLRSSQVGRKINRKTGKLAIHHTCAICGDSFPTKEVQVDHKTPVVPLTGFDSWSSVVERMFVEEEGLRVLCKPCHKTVTDEENKTRRENKKKEP